MRRCPYCAEEVLDDARKCRFCGEWLGQPETEEFLDWLRTLNARRTGRLGLWTLVAGCAFIVAAFRPLAVAAAAALLVVAAVCLVVDFAERGGSGGGRR